MKTQTVGAYMRGKAQQWLEFYVNSRNFEFPPWTTFCRDICQRFDLGSYEKHVLEWRRVSQKGTVLEYQEEFEQAKARVQCEESFAVEMFIGGLKEELQHTLINLNPATLGQAFHAARIEEDDDEEIEAPAFAAVAQKFLREPTASPGVQKLAVASKYLCSNSTRQRGPETCSRQGFE